MKKHMTRFETFSEEVGGLNTNKIKFRPAAPFTNPFGLTRRYRVIDGENEWGWPGIHFGVDRPEGPNKERRIFAPVKGQGRFEDWEGNIYGSLFFIQHWADFEVVIAHIYPEDIVPSIFFGGELAAGDPIGLAGDYGFSFGIHTHTEIRAEKIGNKILDEFVQRKYGTKGFIDLTEEEILTEYRGCEKTTEWTTERILADYKKLRRDKHVLTVNRYRMVRQMAWTKRTYYSSQLVLDF